MPVFRFICTFVCCLFVIDVICDLLKMCDYLVADMRSHCLHLIHCDLIICMSLTQDDYYKQPAWKQKDKKKRLGIF